MARLTLTLRVAQTRGPEKPRRGFSQAVHPIGKAGASHPQRSQTKRDTPEGETTMTLEHFAALAAIFVFFAPLAALAFDQA
jgi:hypothetical protein